MKNITHLLDVIDQVRDHMALGLMSDPGLSKTAQVKQWAEKNDRRYCELIISQRMPSEISGMPMPVPKTSKMEIFDFETLLELKDGDVLAFDEFTNGNIQTLNACLTLIQERTMLSGKKLPSLVIVAMGNPQGKCELLPQTKQRFWWVEVVWDAVTWKDYMLQEWGIIVNGRVLDYISEQYSTGFANHKTYNYNTPRTIENLFRVAKTIESSDPFWTVSDVDRPLVEAIYQCLTGKDEFDTLVQRLIDWVDDNSTPETALHGIGLELRRCTSMDDLKQLVHRLEEGGEDEEFIAFLKADGGMDDA